MRKTHVFAGLVCAAAALAVTSSANADVVSWADWSNTYTAGSTGGSATATVAIPSSPAITVAYTGEVISVYPNYPSWTPSSSYVGGTVGNAPLSSDGIVQIQGGGATSTDTITFSTAVINPVMAIWSLGQQPPNQTIDASFVFTANEQFAIEAGGPSTEYNGNPITASGDSVHGLEGNGTIQFIGSYTSITFTTPVNEYWYGFTVGVDIGGGKGATVPVPASALSGGMLLAGVALTNKLRRRRQA